MTQKEAIELLKTEKEIVALNAGAYAQFLALGLGLLYQGVYPIAKVVKGYSDPEPGKVVE
jgi:hypothetical protein